VYTYEKEGEGAEEEERGIRKKKQRSEIKAQGIVGLNQLHESVDITRSSPYSQGEKHQSILPAAWP